MASGAAESETLCMHGHSRHENREILMTSGNPPSDKRDCKDRSANTNGGTAGAHVIRKSDESIIPMNPPNKGAAETPAEAKEESDSAKRNDEQNHPPRTRSRQEGRSQGLIAVRRAARKGGVPKFTALLHHVDTELLTDAFHALKRTAAVGVDNVTWHEYRQNLEANITDLHERIHRGTYRAKPSRRTWIPKADGRQRPIGIASLEDKIVQQAVVWVLECIYEEEFLGFSYGFRPNRGAHDALDALSVAISRNRVNWILDADVQGFFDAIDHEWLIKFVEHLIGDPRILKLIKKWLRAGVSEDGEWSATTVGTPQGAVISPLLANVYLHYVFDLWINWWRNQPDCQGKVSVVRYADDFVIGFECKADAERCLRELQERFAKFGLKLHPTKTRLIEFGRYAANNRKHRGEGKPETFDFLGFTHCCGRTRSKGYFTVHRHPIAKRVRKKLAEISDTLGRRMHRPLWETGCWLRQVINGWLQYYAVPGTSRKLDRFVQEVTRIWLQMIRRRSQRGKRGWTWERMKRIARLYLPRPKIRHPYPSTRFDARRNAGAV